jgi:hypothetical protein
MSTTNLNSLAQKINGAVINGAAAAMTTVITCTYCETPLSGIEINAIREAAEGPVDAADWMCDACAEADPQAPGEPIATVEGDTLEAKLAALEALRTSLLTEQAKLKNGATATTTLAVKVKREWQTQTTCKFAGTFPTNANAQDKALLMAVWACRGRLEVGSKYTVPATEAHALFSYLYKALAAKYPAKLTGHRTLSNGKQCPVYDNSAAQAVLYPAMESAVSRGIITKTWGHKTALYFDARELPPTAVNDRKAPDASVKAAMVAAF